MRQRAREVLERKFVSSTSRCAETRLPQSLSHRWALCLDHCLFLYTGDRAEHNVDRTIDHNPPDPCAYHKLTAELFMPFPAMPLKRTNDAHYNQHASLQRREQRSTMLVRCAYETKRPINFCHAKSCNTNNKQHEQICEKT